MFRPYDASASHAGPVVFGIPYDGGSSFLRGAALAPRLIREALWSPHSNLSTELHQDLSMPGLVRDAGDSQVAERLPEVAPVINSIRDSGAVPVVLGGDHSITYCVLRAFAKPRVLIVDAHPDLYETFEGNRYGHASWCARALEEDLVERVTVVGVRTINPHQQEQARRFGVEIIEMRDWEVGVRPALDKSVYLSVDIDGIDPAHAPGVSHPEPGGLTPRDVLQLIHAVPRITGADLVEYNPLRDVNGVTSFLCAKLLKEICGQIVAST